ncbi:hypothetical protein GCM10027406_32010 [Leifsonia lichenia]
MTSSRSRYGASGPNVCHRPERSAEDEDEDEDEEGDKDRGGDGAAFAASPPARGSSRFIRIERRYEARRRRRTREAIPVENSRNLARVENQRTGGTHTSRLKKGGRTYWGEQVRPLRRMIGGNRLRRTPELIFGRETVYAESMQTQVFIGDVTGRL